jgi:hypothetical protein
MQTVSTTRRDKIFSNAFTYETDIVGLYYMTLKEKEHLAKTNELPDTQED